MTATALEKRKERLSANKQSMKKKTETQIKLFQECAKQNTAVVELVRMKKPSTSQKLTSKESSIGQTKKPSIDDDNDVILVCDEDNNVVDETLRSSSASSSLCTEAVQHKKNVSINHMGHAEKKLAEEVLKPTGGRETRVDLVRLGSSESSTPDKRRSAGVYSPKALEQVRDQEKRLSAILKPVQSERNDSVYRQPPAPSSISQPNRILPSKLCLSAVKVVNLLKIHFSNY